MAHQPHIDPKPCKNPSCQNGGVIPVNPGRGRSVFCSEVCENNYPVDLKLAEQNARQYLSRHTRRQVLWTGLAGVSTLRCFADLLEAPTRIARYERAWQELSRVRRGLIEIPSSYPEVAEEAKSVAHSVQLLIQNEKRKGLEAAYLWNTADQILMEAGEQGDVPQIFRILSTRAARIKHFWKGQKNPIEYAKALIVQTCLHYRYAEVRSETKKKYLGYAFDAINEAIGILEEADFRQNKVAAHDLLCLAVLWKFKLFAFPLNRGEEAENYLNWLDDLSNYTESPWVWLQIHSQTAGFTRIFQGDITGAEHYIEAAYHQYRKFTIKSPMIEMSPLRAKIETLSIKSDSNIDDLKKCIKDYSDLVHAYPLLFNVKHVSDFRIRFKELGLSDITIPAFAYTYETPITSWVYMTELFPAL